jgi:hypothetical protein
MVGAKGFEPSTSWPRTRASKNHKSFLVVSHTTKIAFLVKPSSEPKLNLNTEDEICTLLPCQKSRHLYGTLSTLRMPVR